MKKISLIFLLFISLVSFGQTYSYSKKTVKVSIQTANGNEYRTLNTYQGPYRFVFENTNTRDKLFTLLKPNENLSPGQQWYGFLKDVGYIEKDSIIYQKSIYLYTGTNEKVMVLISSDFNKIIIFNQDDSIWEFSD
jgi:hypothetical protein